MEQQADAWLVDAVCSCRQAHVCAQSHPDCKEEPAKAQPAQILGYAHATQVAAAAVSVRRSRIVRTTCTTRDRICAAVDSALRL